MPIAPLRLREQDLERMGPEQRRLGDPRRGNGRLDWTTSYREKQTLPWPTADVWGQLKDTPGLEDGLGKQKQIDHRQKWRKQVDLDLSPSLLLTGQVAMVQSYKKSCHM